MSGVKNSWLVRKIDQKTQAHIGNSIDEAECHTPCVDSEEMHCMLDFFNKKNKTFYYHNALTIQNTIEDKILSNCSWTTHTPLDSPALRLNNLPKVTELQMRN